MVQEVGVIYMDLWKTFGSLDHGLLITKLKRYRPHQHAISFSGVTSQTPSSAVK